MRRFKLCLFILRRTDTDGEDRLPSEEHEGVEEEEEKLCGGPPKLFYWEMKKSFAFSSSGNGLEVRDAVAKIFYFLFLFFMAIIIIIFPNLGISDRKDISSALLARRFSCPITNLPLRPAVEFLSEGG